MGECYTGNPLKTQNQSWALPGLDLIVKCVVQVSLKLLIIEKSENKNWYNLSIYIQCSRNRDKKDDRQDRKEVTVREKEKTKSNDQIIFEPSNNLKAEPSPEHEAKNKPNCPT